MKNLLYKTSQKISKRLSVGLLDESASTIEERQKRLSGLAGVLIHRVRLNQDVSLLAVSIATESLSMFKQLGLEPVVDKINGTLFTTCVLSKNNEEAIFAILNSSDFINGHCLIGFNISNIKIFLSFLTRSYDISSLFFTEELVLCSNDGGSFDWYNPMPKIEEELLS